MNNTLNSKLKKLTRYIVGPKHLSHMVRIIYDQNKDFGESCEAFLYFEGFKHRDEYTLIKEGTKLTINI